MAALSTLRCFLLYLLVIYAAVAKKPDPKSTRTTTTKTTTTTTTTTPVSIYTPPFVSKSAQLPTYPFPLGICANQNPSKYDVDQSVESRRAGVRKLSLSFSSDGNYDSATTYANLLKSSQPNRLVFLMYYQAALNNYNLVDIAYANLAAGLMAVKNPRDGGAAMEFEYWYFLDTFLRSQCLVTPELIRTVLAYYQSVSFAGWTTSNLSLLASVTRYLIGQTFPNATFSNNGADHTGRTNVLDRAKGLYYSPPGEFASQDYGVYDLFSFVTVAHFAKEPEIAGLAELGIQVSMGRYAAVWWSTRLAVECMRCESNTYHNWNIWWFLADLWVYFGDSNENILEQKDASWLLTYSASVNYNMDPIALSIAQTKGPKHVRISGLGEFSYYLQSYITDSYSLYTINNPPIHGSSIPGQSTLPGVFWDGHAANEVRNSSVSNFFLGVMINGDITANGDWNGYVQEWLLHENSMVLVVDDVRKALNYTKTPHPVVVGFMPSSTQYWDGVVDTSCAAVICGTSSSYYAFFGFGSNAVLIAVISSQPLHFGTIPKAQNDRSFYANLTAQSTAGFAIECALPTQFTGSSLKDQLASFKMAIFKNKFIFTDATSPTNRAQVNYTNLAGDILWKEFEYSDNIPSGYKGDWFAAPPLETVNGVHNPAFLQWPLVDSPLVFQSNYPGFSASSYSYGNYPPCPFFWRPNVTSNWVQVPYNFNTYKFKTLPPGVTCVAPPSSSPKKQNAAAVAVQSTAYKKGTNKHHKFKHRHVAKKHKHGV